MTTTVTRRRTAVAGSRKLKTFTVTITADGDTLDTRMRRIENVRFTNPAPARVTGTATLSGGTVTVSDTRVRTGSSIRATMKTAGGTPGDLGISTVVDATSFIILSTSGSDTSIVNWEIVNPAIDSIALPAAGASTITFKTNMAGTITGALVECEG